jgi:hypothetical protein
MLFIEVKDIEDNEYQVKVTDFIPVKRTDETCFLVCKYDGSLRINITDKAYLEFKKAQLN